MGATPIAFDWDQWNVQKNELKHAVSSDEAESVFGDPNLRIYKDLKHSSLLEQRLIAYGRSFEDRVLMLGFTVRRQKIRIITARPASRKERDVYES